MQLRVDAVLFLALASLACDRAAPAPNRPEARSVPVPRSTVPDVVPESAAPASSPATEVVGQLAEVATPARDKLALVAGCATEAVRVLGWNPLPHGAHHGSVIRTSIVHGGSADCAPLAHEKNKFQFEVDGDVIDWDWGPKDQPNATTIRFTFRCRGCGSPIETRVTLPRRWYCFSWIERERSGSVCQPSRASCEAARASFRPASPCELHTGAAWCLRSDMSRCSDSPWSCANNPRAEPCERAP